MYYCHLIGRDRVIYCNSYVTLTTTTRRVLPQKSIVLRLRNAEFLTVMINSFDLTPSEPATSRTLVIHIGTQERKYRPVGLK